MHGMNNIKFVTYKSES